MIKPDNEENKNTINMPLMPLRDVVIFPHMIVPIFIGENLCVNAVETALSLDRKIFLSAFKVVGGDNNELSAKTPPPFDVYDVGTICTIVRTRNLPDGRMKVLVQGLERAEIEKVHVANTPLAEIHTLSDPMIPSESNAKLEALLRIVKENLEKITSLGKVLAPDILILLEDMKDPYKMADLIAANLGLRVEEAQELLTLRDIVEKFQFIHQFLCKEIEVLEMQLSIQNQAKEEINRIQKEHYLREQIKVLKTELGDKDGKDDVDDLLAKLDSLKLVKETHEEISKQIKRLGRMHQDTSEASLTRTHIETLLSLPWNVHDKDSIDLKNTEGILDEDHFGLEQVKDRILEFLAVKKLNPNAKSPILCFVGPPGVGKTSLGRSIAKSMGRAFARISLGGVRDEADIRGHRKTYIGAFPGRIIQALKQAGTNNPVIMLDEIDKLGSDHRGDPSSALLEVLDPEQNSNFVDHYLGVAFDLSKVMFIANANALDTIVAPLRDRLELIEVSGYSEIEKIEIADRFLIPKQISEAGLSGRGVSLSKSSVKKVIRDYTRESGLRGLEKRIASLFRKIAREVAEGMSAKTEFKITPTNVSRYLGVGRYGKEFFHGSPAVGVSLGMAFTSYGGEILAIESTLLPGKSGLVLTGQLGEVMKESAQAALSYIRSQYRHFDLSEGLLSDSEIHVHLPQGATPKDGPSAGIALVTSMLSALLGRAPLESTSMTGEITLLGKVLPIGGLKEKLLAAQREGIKRVIIPSANRAIFEELPAHVRRGITVYFVDHYDEVFRLAFRGEGIQNGRSEDAPLHLAS